MKGFTPVLIIGLIAVFGILFLSGSKLIGIASFIGLPSATLSGCTWGNDYCYVTCMESGSATTTFNLPYQCPSTADVEKCEIQVLYHTGALYLTPQAHKYSSCTTGWLGMVSCTGDLGMADAGSELQRGVWMYGYYSGSSLTAMATSARVKVVRKALKECGLAACSAGSGIPITSADGCSWDPRTKGSDQYTWEDGTAGAKSIPFGESFRYVCSQHLLACAEECTNDLLCAMPVNLETLQVLYNGKYYNAYCSSRLLHVVGCKPQSTCTQRDLLGNCQRYENRGGCGEVATLNAGQCCQDSDCGAVGTYYCEFANNAGTCKPFAAHDCIYDYDCGQTGTGCFSKRISTVRCVAGGCINDQRAVGCCTSTDCPTGYYCNSQYTCKASQFEPADCPFDCCDTRYNNQDSIFKPKVCPADKAVCCGNHVCATTQDTCAVKPVPKPSIDYFAMFIVAFIISVVLLGLLWMFTPAKLFLRRPVTFILLAVVLALVLTIVFTAPIATLAASIVT